MDKKKRNHYLKIRKEGGSRVLAVGRFLPPDWKIVWIELKGEHLTAEHPWVILIVEKVA